MILPLVTLPYLVKVLSVENFGLISFALSVVMYFNILVDFGFDLSATRSISLNRKDINKVSEIFSAVMFLKFFLILISLITLTVLVLSIDTLGRHKMLYFITFGVVLGNSIFPVWFFQGMEKMKHIALINVVTKTIFTFLIFVFVTDREDYIYVPLLNSFGAIVSGLYSLLVVFKLFKVKFKLPNWGEVIVQLKESYLYFISRVANDGSRFYATTIIGLFFGNIILGYFAMVEKLFYAFMNVGGVVSQTIYPYMSRTRDLKFYKKVLYSTTTVAVLLLVPILYFNEVLLSLVFNIKKEILSNLFLIIFSGGIFGIISALIGYPLLAAYGYIKYANNSLIYASVCYVVFITIAVSVFGDIYTVASSLIVYHLAGLIFRLYYVNKTKIFYGENILNE